MTATTFADQDTIVFIGGAIHESDAQGANQLSAWVRRFQDLLVAHEPEKQITCIDKTAIGQHFHDMRQRWDDDVIWHQPQYVCVVLGLDDAWTAIRGAEVQKDQASLTKELGELLAYHKQHCPQTKFILMDLSFLSLNDDPAWNTGQVLGKIKPLQAALAMVAEKHSAKYIPTQEIVESYLQREGDLCFGGEDAHPDVEGSVVYAHSLYESFCDKIPAAQNRMQQQQRVVFIGDSITDCGRRSVAGRPFGFGYMRIWRSLMRARQAELTYSLEMFNRGVGGNTIRNLQHRWQTDCLDLKPDHLVVKIGINDINRTISGGENSVTVDDYTTIFRDILGRVRQQNPDCSITLISPFYLSRCANPVNYRKKVLEALDEYLAALQEIVKEFDAGLVNLHELFQKHLDYRSPAEFGARNGIDIVHPSESGVMIMAEALYKELS